MVHVFMFVVHVFMFSRSLKHFKPTIIKGCYKCKEVALFTTEHKLMQVVNY